MIELIRRLRHPEYKKSFSQCGEDLILSFIFQCLGIQSPSYLDIGAHHPVILSNTYLFYQRGCRGVLVEPDPELYAGIAQRRSRDTCLNVGIGVNGEESADFYVMSTRALSTFSKSEVERYVSYGTQKIERTIRVSMVSINEIVARYFDKHPNFISLDTEGLDLPILEAFDFSSHRPEVFCVETLTYTENKSEKKIMESVDFMISNGYFVYADTYINSIFVDKQAWKNR